MEPVPEGGHKKSPAGAFAPAGDEVSGWNLRLSRYGTKATEMLITITMPIIMMAGLPVGMAM